MSVSGSIDSNTNSNPVFSVLIDPNEPFPLLASSFLIAMKAVVSFNLLTGNREAEDVVDVHHAAVKDILKEDLRNIISIFGWNGIKLSDQIPAQIQKRPLMALLQMLADYFNENNMVAREFPHLENPLSPTGATSPAADDMTIADNIIRVSRIGGNVSVTTILAPVMDQLRANIAEASRVEGIRRQALMDEANEQVRIGQRHEAQLEVDRLAALARNAAAAAAAATLSITPAVQPIIPVNTNLGAIIIDNVIAPALVNETDSTAANRRMEEERLTAQLLESERLAAEATSVREEASALALTNKRHKLNSSESVSSVAVFSIDSIFGGERATNIINQAKIINAAESYDDMIVVTGNGVEFRKQIQLKSSSSITLKNFVIFPNQVLPSDAPLTANILLNKGCAIYQIISIEMVGRNKMAKIKQLIILGNADEVDKSMKAEIKTIVLPSTLLVLNSYGMEFFGDALPVIEIAKPVKNSYENRLGNYLDLTNFKTSLNKAKDIDTLTVLADPNRLLSKYGLTGDDGVTVDPVLYVKQLGHNVDVLSSIYHTSCSSASASDPADIAQRTFSIVRMLLKTCLDYDAFMEKGRIHLMLLGKMTNAGFKSLSFVNFQKRQPNGSVKYPANVDELCACLTGFENGFCVLFAAEYRGMFSKFINHLMVIIFSLNLTIKYVVGKIHVNFCLLFHYFSTKSINEFPMGDPAQLAIYISNHMMNIDFSQQDQAMVASGNQFVYHPDEFTVQVPEQKGNKKNPKENFGRQVGNLSDPNALPLPTATGIKTANATANAASIAATKLAASNAAAAAAAALAAQNNSLG